MRTVLAALCILACLPAQRVAAAPEEHEVCLQGLQCRLASHAELDELRGGFDLDTRGGRVRLNIGITRAVAVNDRFVAVSHLEIPDLGQMIAASPQGSRTTQVSAPPGAVVTLTNDALIVQNGPDNHIAPTAFNGASFPTIIQNTLDDQKLNTFTIVNARVNALSVLRQLRTGEIMSRAAATSGR